MCIVMIVSVFTVMNVNSLAAKGSDVMTVTQSAISNGKITYTIKLKSNISFSAVINQVKFDPEVLSPVGVTYCGEYENGFYIPGALVAGTNDRYSMALVNGTSVWNSSKNGTTLAKVTFKIIDSKATSFSTSFYCAEFNSTTNSIANNISNPSLITSLKSSALAPVKMASAKTADGGIQVSWYKTPNAAKYVVYRKVDGSWKRLADVDGSKSSYIDKTIEHNTTGEYTVRAYDADDYRDSGIGNSVKGKYIMAPKTVKTELVANGVKVSWTGVSGATEYRVYRRVLYTNGTVSDWSSAYVYGAKVRNFTDKKSLKSNTKYQYVVRAVTSSGTSAACRTASVWYYAAPSVTVSSVEGGINIKWSKISGATSYKIYRRYSTTSSWTVVKTVGSGTSSYIDKPNITVKKVYYTVRAFAKNGSSKYVQKSLAYVKTPILKAPTNTANSIKVTWTPIKGAQGYIVYRKAGSATKWTNLGKVKSASYTDKNVKAGTNYTYTVRAYYKNCLSGFDKDGIKVRRLKQPVLSKAVNNAAGIGVTWSKVAGATGYKVYRKTTGGWSQVGNVKTTSFTDKKVKNGIKYTYTVRATYGSSISSFNSKGVSVKCK